MKGHTQNVDSVHFCPDNQTLASGSHDASIRIWNASNGDCLGILQGHSQGVRCVRYSPDGQRLASSYLDESIRIWSKKFHSKFDQSNLDFKLLNGHTNWVRGIVFSPDGDILASGSDEDTLRLWSVEDGGLLNTGMNSRFRNCYKPSRVSFVTSSEKLIHTMNQQRQVIALR